MSKKVIDIRLNTGEPNKVVVDGIDLTGKSVKYLLLELRGGLPARYIIRNRKPETWRERIAMWFMDGGQ